MRSRKLPVGGGARTVAVRVDQAAQEGGSVPAGGRHAGPQTPACLIG